MTLNEIKDHTFSLIDPLKSHLLGAISFVIMWLSPIHLAIGVVLVAMLIDTLAGRWAAGHQAKLDGVAVREAVTSRKTKDGFISKVFLYIGSIVLTFVLDKLLLHDIVGYFLPDLRVEYFVTKVLAFIYVAMEFDSFDEKYYRVKNKSLKSGIVEQVRKIKKSLYEVIKIKKEL